MLINVTQFLPRRKRRSMSLAETIVPELIAPAAAGQSRSASGTPDAAPARRPTRSPCSSSRTIAAAKRNVKLQIFASDVDDDALAVRPQRTIPGVDQRDVSPARLNRFFVKEDQGYRVTRELRETVVFTDAGSAGRCAVLAPRLRHLPQCAHLFAPRGSGESPLAVPFRTARRRNPVSRRLRDRRQTSATGSSRSPRSSGSSGISAAAARAKSSFPIAPGQARGRRPRPRDGPSRGAAHHDRRPRAAGAARRLCAGLGPGQRQARGALLLRPDRPLSEGAAGEASQDLLAMAREGCAQSSGRRSARPSREQACVAVGRARR